MIDLNSANTSVHNFSAEEIILYTLKHSHKIVLTSSFGVNSAVLLHMVSSIDKNIPIVWIDHGFNLPDTLRVARKLQDSLNLNLKIYKPSLNKQEILEKFGGELPSIDDASHAKFTQLVKLDLMQKMLDEIKPVFWISGVRSVESEVRKKMQVFTEDKKRNVIKVAPILAWNDSMIEDYMQKFSLPSPTDYFDPTKVEYGRECGLHT